MPPPREVFAVDYTLDHIMVVPEGWRAVLWTGTAHTVRPVYLLGMARTATQTPAQIVSLTYTPPAGWVCNEEDASFCGLLPPGWDLGRYEAQDPYGHVSQAEE